MSLRIVNYTLKSKDEFGPNWVSRAVMDGEIELTQYSFNLKTGALIRPQHPIMRWGIELYDMAFQLAIADACSILRNETNVEELKEMSVGHTVRNFYMSLFPECGYRPWNCGVDNPRSDELFFPLRCSAGQDLLENRVFEKYPVEFREKFRMAKFL